MKACVLKISKRTAQTIRPDHVRWIETAIPKLQILTIGPLPSSDQQNAEWTGNIHHVGALASSSVHLVSLTINLMTFDWSKADFSKTNLQELCLIRCGQQTDFHHLRLPRSLQSLTYKSYSRRAAKALGMFISLTSDALKPLQAPTKLLKLLLSDLEFVPSVHHGNILEYIPRTLRTLAIVDSVCHFQLGEAPFPDLRHLNMRNTRLQTTASQFLRVLSTTLKEYTPPMESTGIFESLQDPFAWTNLRVLHLIRSETFAPDCDSLRMLSSLAEFRTDTQPFSDKAMMTATHESMVYEILPPSLVCIDLRFRFPSAHSMWALQQFKKLRVVTLINTWLSIDVQKLPPSLMVLVHHDVPRIICEKTMASELSLHRNLRNRLRNRRDRPRVIVCANWDRRNSSMPDVLDTEDRCFDALWWNSHHAKFLSDVK